MVGDNAPTKPVVQMEIENPRKIIKEYKSAVEAGRATGVCSRNISACCLRQGQITAGGYYWCFREDFDKFEPQEKRQGKTNLRKVYCFETDSIFDSIVEAATKLHIGKDGIYACCKNKQSSTGNCNFCYYEEMDYFKKEAAHPMGRSLKNSKKKTDKANPIYQIEKHSLKPLHLFSNIAQASIVTGISRQQIGMCVREKCKTAGNYYWCKKDQWYEGWSPTPQRHPNSKAVFCIETNQKFETLSYAVKSTGINASSISECCNKKLNTAGGLHWCFYAEFILGNYCIPPKKTTKKVVCVETKEVFDSIKSAANKYNIFQSGISECVKNQAHTCGGFHWCLLANFEEKRAVPKQRTSVMKKVRNIDTNMIFNSIREAALNSGICEQNIGRVCKGKAKTAGGFHWEYEQ